MTQLIMIRHGQASFGQRNYDNLSELGREQARITGRALRAQGLQFDVLISGSMQRQRDSAEQAALAFDAPPALEIRDAFNEYNAESISAAYLQRVLAEDPELAQQGPQLFKNPKLFQTAFSRMTRLWLADAPHTLKNFESWVQFRQRVSDGLAQLYSDFGRDARIALFTSGGPISVAVGTCLDATDDMIIQINWSVINASLTEFRSNRQGWRMVGFNNVSHFRLENDPGLVTHR